MYFPKYVVGCSTRNSAPEDYILRKLIAIIYSNSCALVLFLELLLCHLKRATKNISGLIYTVFI